MRSFFAAPIAVDLSITGRCNLNCSYCYASAGLGATDLPFSIISRLFDEASFLGIHFIRLAGGEPFLHKSINSILRTAAAHDFHTSVSSNGIVISDDQLQSLRDFRIGLVLSIDSHIAQIHEANRGSFAATMRTLERALQLGVAVSTATVLTSQNAGHIESLLEHLKSQGVHRSAILLLCPVGRGAKFKQLATKAQLSAAIHGANRFRMKYPEYQLSLVAPHESEVPWEHVAPVALAHPSDLGIVGRTTHGPRKLGCYAGISTCAICADGRVFGCEQMSGFSELEAGNILHQTLAVIWRHSGVLSRLREIEIEGLQGNCATCVLEGCGGGCRAAAYSQSHSLSASDPRCAEWSNEIRAAAQELYRIHN